MVSRFGCFELEFWVLRFRVLGASFSSLRCFVFEIWVLRASVFVFECFISVTRYLLKSKIQAQLTRNPEPTNAEKYFHRFVRVTFFLGIYNKSVNNLFLGKLFNFFSQKTNHQRPLDMRTRLDFEFLLHTPQCILKT